MSDVELNALSNWSFGGESAAQAELDRLMLSAVRDAMEVLDVQAVAIYLRDTAGSGLRAAMIGGTPPAVFAIPESFHVSAAEGRDDTPAAERGDQAGGSSGPLPLPWGMTTAPLSTTVHEFGVLAVMYAEREQENPSDREERSWLVERAKALAVKLSALAGCGISVVPGVRPSLIPLYKAVPAASNALSWGVPGMPGSAGMTFTYQLRNLVHALNRTTTVEAAVVQAYRHLALAFGGKAVTVSTVRGGRLWIAGHRGQSIGYIRSLHGASVRDNTLTADVLNGRALFFNDRSHLFESYPDALDDGHQAWAFLPLRGSSHHVGICSVSFAAPRLFTREEEAILILMADQLASTLERVLVCHSLHGLAETLQRTLLPRMLSELPGAVVAARYLPAQAASGIGGDWYDVLQLGQGRTYLVIGDVEGHDFKSAAVMGQLRSAVLAYATEGHGPGVIMTRTNMLLDRLETDLLATCCIVLLDQSGGTVEIASAGHPAPVLRGPEQLQHPLEVAVGLPLGVDPAAVYQTVETAVRPGSLLFLYTDGLYDAQAPGIVERAQALLNSVCSHSDRDPEDIADRLVRELSVSGELRDDVCLLFTWLLGSGDEDPRTSRMIVQRHDLLGVKRARRFTGDTLEEWGLGAISDSIKLMVSEVVTNALIHADSDVDVRLREYPHRVRVEIRDTSALPPVPSALSLTADEKANAEHGRGLMIVEQLASAWGTSPNGLGKTVWMELKS